MKPLSTLSRSIPTSGIKAMRDLVRTLEGVIHLEVGEPDFPTPPEVIDSALRAAKAGATRYTPTPGIPELRQAIAAKVSRRYGLPAKADGVVVTAGGTQALTATTLTLVERGDEVLVPDPGWPNYAAMTYLAGATAVPYAQTAAHGFLPDVAQIERLVTPRTKMIMINNPGNPGGAVFPRSLVEDLMRLATSRDLYVVSDEIYEDFTFDADHVPAAAFDTEGRVVTISGFSKTYSMTGWRLGYVVTTPGLATEIARVAGPLLSCSSHVSQSAGLAALQLDEAKIEAMRDSYRRRRDLVRSILQPAGLLPVVPSGAFYAMVDLSRVSGDSNQAALKLLEQQRVATTPGDAFGAEGRGFVRISFATAEDELGEALRRIRTFAEGTGRAASEPAESLVRTG